MAEPEYPAPWNSLPPGSEARGSGLAAPPPPSLALPFPQPFAPLPYEAPYAAFGNPSLPPYWDAPPHLSSQPQTRSPYPLDGGHQMYFPQSRMYPYVPAHPRPPPAFRTGSTASRTDLTGMPDSGDFYPRMEHPLLPVHGLQPMIPPFANNFEPPLSPPAGPNPLPQRQNFSMMGGPVMGLRPIQRFYGTESGRPSSDSSPDQPRHIQSPNRRVMQQEAPQSGTRNFDGAERRASFYMSPQSRRSDRSISPRTSNRRSYDRYSIDLSQSTTSSDAEEAAARAPPSNRMRHRPREVRPRFAAYAHHFDPNIPTSRQIQDLKDKLTRRLPTELPAKTSPCCDICQKDYSNKHVQPCEEEEVAVELSCGHVFGEYCIFQWVCTRLS